MRLSARPAAPDRARLSEPKAALAGRFVPRSCRVVQVAVALVYLSFLFSSESAETFRSLTTQPRKMKSPCGHRNAQGLV